MCNTTPLLPSLSPVSGKTVEAAFEGGSLTSDADVLVLREVERRLDVGGRLAACIATSRSDISRRKAWPAGDLIEKGYLSAWLPPVGSDDPQVVAYPRGHDSGSARHARGRAAGEGRWRRAGA